MFWPLALGVSGGPREPHSAPVSAPLFGRNLEANFGARNGAINFMASFLASCFWFLASYFRFLRHPPGFCANPGALIPYRG